MLYIYLDNTTYRYEMKIFPLSLNLEPEPILLQAVPSFIKKAGIRINAEADLDLTFVKGYLF